jgi:hypothetical protein
MKELLEVERCFGVKRSMDKNLMRASGAAHNFGRECWVAKSSMLDLVEKLLNAESPVQMLATLLDSAPKPPETKPSLVALPEQCRNIRLSELPPGRVSYGQGRLEFRGDGFTILESLALFVRALENEGVTEFVSKINELPKYPIDLSAL